MIDNLVERYEGVRTLGNADPDEIGVGRPAGLDLLKRHYEALPDRLDDGANVKVGLTSSGHAVYRCVPNGRLGYYLIVLRPGGRVDPGRSTYRPKSAQERIDVPTEPHDGFGDRWLVTPERDTRPSVQEQYGA